MSIPYINYRYLKNFIFGILVISSILLQPSINKRFLNIFARYYFDKNYYLTNYPDVKNTNINPFKHYIKFGWKEKRNPSASFNTDYYVSKYLIHNKYKLNPLADYVKSKILFKGPRETLAQVHLLKGPKYYLSLVSVFQNEARFLKEWIEFHLSIGVEHFYLHNHLSTDNYMEVLEPYIKKGIVDLYQITEQPQNPHDLHQMLCKAYTKTAHEVKDITEWLSVTDTDEFLFPVKGQNLGEVLKKYDDYATVVVYWTMFGSSDVEKIPSDKLMIESLTKSSTHQGEYVKSIIKPRYLHHFGHAHFPLLLTGYNTITENFDYFVGQIIPPERRNINLRINHYWARDLEFYRNHKIWRNSFNSLTDEEKKATTERMIQHNKDLSVDYDDAILRFVPNLRKRMALGN